MTVDVTFKPSANARIAAFLRALPGAECHRGALLFPRAARAIFLRRSRIRIAPAAVVAYFDECATYRLFDTSAGAFAAYCEYRAQGAPCVLLTINALVVAKSDTDEPPIDTEADNG